MNVLTNYSSSQACSVHNNGDVKYKDLKERKYKCVICHNELDCDYNANVNIIFEGLRLFMKNNYNLI